MKSLRHRRILRRQAWQVIKPEIYYAIGTLLAFMVVLIVTATFLLSLSN